MATHKESSQRAARLALRLHRRTQNHLSTSYRESRGLSSSPDKETSPRPEGAKHTSTWAGRAPEGVGLKDGEAPVRLSWLDLSDDRWPSDYWRVGADIRPELWPELWTFLVEGGG